ncbi:hypothetical protein BIV57_11345, partial [Mangrovactinospora gilvigrisea]
TLHQTQYLTRQQDATLAHLATVLDAPVKDRTARTGKPLARHVWHCPVRAAPEDRILTDADWEHIARRLVAAASIAPHGDDDACRWIAVRHADDHIHIVATTVRQDGRRPTLHRDALHIQAECRRIEIEYGLRRLNPGDGTHSKRPTSAEQHKARRTGRTTTAREQLRTTARQCLAAADSDTDYLQRLRAAGVRVKVRHAPSGDLLGYSLALPGDRNRHGQPVWYPGSTLAPDLSLPKVRQWLSGTGPGERSTAPRRPSTARHAATRAAEAALGQLSHRSTSDADAAAALTATGALLDALASTTNDTQLGDAARAFERATRIPVAPRHAGARDLARAARDLARAGSALGRGDDQEATAMLLSTLVQLALAVAAWHFTHHHLQQAAAAQVATAHLRTAYASAARRPLAAWHAQGRALSDADLMHLTSAIRAGIPERAEQVLAEAAWPALAAVLRARAAAGDDPIAVLREAAADRELESADAVSEVLVWRIQRLTRQRRPDQAQGDRERMAPSNSGTMSAEVHTDSGGSSRRPHR